MEAGPLVPLVPGLPISIEDAGFPPNVNFLFHLGSTVWLFQKTGWWIGPVIYKTLGSDEKL